MGLFLRVFAVECAKMLPANLSPSNGTEEGIRMRPMLQALMCNLVSERSSVAWLQRGTIFLEEKEKRNLLSCVLCSGVRQGDAAIYLIAT
jgi:hypothetical protein